ncbi:hypothetical protein JCM10908_004224 [Rhodotorula pacifica]|uniref:uncharacterized protein n=1 Tax=Rhodotorula pacifica TaxID=1495444 RepID=UPI003175ADEC
MAMHRRAPASSSTTSSTAHARTTAAATTTTMPARARATATTTTTPERVTTPAALAVGTSSTSFSPGVAASGTATSLAPDTPPAPSGFLTSGTPSGTFAQQGVWGPQSHSYQPVSSSASHASASNSSTGLSKPALYAIIAGGSAAGVILLALLGFCCWKRRKAKAADNDLGWRNLDTPAARPIRDSQLMYKSGEDDGRQVSHIQHDSYHTGVGSFAGQPEKPWAQQSFSSLSSFDEKGQARGFVHDASDAYSLRSQQADQYSMHRQELLGSPRGLPRIQTNATLDSFAPPPSIFANAHGRDSTAQSVNSVIDFSASPRQPPRARAPSSIQHAYPPSTPLQPPLRSDSHAAPARQQQQQQPQQQPPSRAQQPPQRHFEPQPQPVSPEHAGKAASPGREAITARHYSSRPFGRASGVPSIDYAQQRIEDDEVEQRVLEVMVGAEPKAQTGPGSRSKTDTIAGIADVYAGADASVPDRESTSAPTRQLRPERTSSRKRTPSAQPQTPLPPLPSASNPAPDQQSSSGYTNRVDSKPLRDLEALFERLPSALSPVDEEQPSSASSASSRSRASEASSYAATNRYTRDDAFSLQPLAPARKASLAKYQQTSRPTAPAPLRIAGKSLAGPNAPPNAVRDDPLSMSVAERDVLSVLGDMQDSTSSRSPPELSFSGSSPPSSAATTPSSDMVTLPDFHLGRSPTSGLKSSYLDIHDSPTHSEFESLDAMNARKHADPSYRSATMSMYDMYD